MSASAIDVAMICNALSSVSRFPSEMATLMDGCDAKLSPYQWTMKENWLNSPIGAALMYLYGYTFIDIFNPTKAYSSAAAVETVLTVKLFATLPFVFSSIIFNIVIFCYVALYVYRFHRRKHLISKD